MNLPTSARIAVPILALILVSGLAGARIGKHAARKELARRDNPESWHEAAMRTFDRTVQPTEAQRAQLQAHLDDAVRELKAIRAETIARSSNVIWKLVADVEKELTPQQRAAFEQMKPKPDDLQTLDLLQVEPHPKR